jgi:hypothetical protein
VDELTRALERAGRGDDPLAVARHARALFRAARPAEALEVLLRRWREAREPAIADLIDEGSIAAPAADWAAVLARKRPPEALELPALLAALPQGTLAQVKPRLPALESWPDDPRTAMALARFVEETPFRSATSKGMWRVVWRLLTRHADPRTVPVLERAKERGSRIAGGSMRSWMEQQLDKALAAIPRVEPERSDAIPPPPSPTASDAGLTRIHERPEQISLRLAWAKELEAKGDPRGEVIRLQHAARERALDRKERARLNRVLHDHAHEWLGPLRDAAVLKSCVYTLGFVSALKMRQLSPREAADLEGRPEWSTVEVLEATCHDGPALARLVQHEAMRSLGTFITERREAVVALRPPGRMRALQCGAVLKPKGRLDDELLDALTGLKGLERLGISARGLKPEEVITLLARLELPKLTSLSLSELSKPAAWLAALEKVRPIETVDVSAEAAISDRYRAATTWLSPSRRRSARAYRRDRKGKFTLVE